MTRDRESLVDVRSASLLDLVHQVADCGVCPREQACEEPNPRSADCAGCIAAWDALNELERRVKGHD